MKNRDGYAVEVSPVEKVEVDGDYCVLSRGVTGTSKWRDGR